MNTVFDADPYPGRPKILFVGPAESTHTRSWIDLLDKSELNVRLFALPSVSGLGLPPENWKVRTYVTTYAPITSYAPWKLDPETRANLYLPPVVRRAERLLQKRYIRRLRLYFHIRPLYRRRFVRQLLGGTKGPEEWLAQVIWQWRPDVIHTFALDPAGHFYVRVCDRFKLAGIGKWVLQLWGGSDLTLTLLDPDEWPRIGNALREGDQLLSDNEHNFEIAKEMGLREEQISTLQVLRRCDQLLSDNEHNFRFAKEIGVRDKQISTLGVVPGIGGIDVASLVRSWHGPPSSRRIILWPKAYESPWSKALPVFEALKIAWDQIQPCQIYMISMYKGNEGLLWYRALPEKIRRSCHTEYRIPRDEVLKLMTQARVMLAPSLIDGAPNSMWEAMAAGALPIVSPLETIRPIAEHERNVLFARNLYPHEIAEALRRAMSDDALVDNVAKRNLEVVRRRADRSRIRPRVIEYYESLAKEQRQETFFLHREHSTPNTAR
jgi:glycosyltransferase involved in cell wall biosynthesis